MRLSMPMPKPTVAITLVTLIGTLAGAPAVLADTLASSAISNSFSASVGSVSTSFNASSDASSPDRPLRTGEYRVMQIVAAPGREGYARLTLRAQAPQASGAPQAAAGANGANGANGAGANDAGTNDASDVHLFLPQDTVAQATLAEGQVISARERPYGLELAKAAAPDQAPQAFFLVLADERFRELRTRPVTL
ncbi:MAG: hypothetical protein HZC37_00090 [Burkholderiales bacterium]|nr:hypothetical protein [Burkholderiales bacterium]